MEELSPLSSFHGEERTSTLLLQHGEEWNDYMEGPLVNPYCMSQVRWGIRVGNVTDEVIERGGLNLAEVSLGNNFFSSISLLTTLMCFLGRSWPSRGVGKLQLCTTCNRERLGSSTLTIDPVQHFRLPLSGMMLSFVLRFVQFLCLIKWGQSD